VFDLRGDCVMLISESKIQSGLFVYRAKLPMVVRSLIDVSCECQTTITINENELVAVDLIYEYESSHQDQTGTFLRLMDHSGFLFVQQQEPEMDGMQVEEGSWSLTIQNDQGMFLRRQPIDRQEMKILPERLFAPSETISCDLKVCGDPGVHFFPCPRDYWLDF